MKKTGDTISHRLAGESRQLSLMTLPVAVWYALFCCLPLFGIAFAFK